MLQCAAYSRDMQGKVKTAVVVGGGVAGATCAAELAALTADHPDVRVEVVLVSASPVVRVATAGALRCGGVQVADEPAVAWAKAAGVRVVEGVAAAMQARSVVLRNGETVSFDACCIASGARPDVPRALQVEDAALKGRLLTVRDTDSVATLRAAVAGARRIAIVGNGGIALELAHEIVGCDVVWVIRDDHVGHSFFDASAGKALAGFLARSDSGGYFGRPEGPGGGERKSVGNVPQGDVLGSGAGPDWLERKERPIFFDKDGNQISTVASGTKCLATDRMQRLRVERQCEVVKVEAQGSGEEYPVKLCLSNTSTVLCDYVVCATGVVPNVSWLGRLCRVPLDVAGPDRRGTECAVNAGGGVLVLAGSMQSVGRKDVFAAGDCATVVRSPDMDANEGNNWIQMRLWTQAAAAGRVAAAGMSSVLLGNGSVGDGMEFDLFAHATRFFGERVVLLGRYSAQGLQDGYRVVEGGNEEQFIRVVLEDGKLRGAVLIGDVDLAETYENLILDRLDLSHIAAEELVDPQIDLDDYFD